MEVCGAQVIQWSVPHSWSPGISLTSTYQEIRALNGGNLCMESGTAGVKTANCNPLSDSQVWYYDTTGHQLKNNGTNSCLDFNGTEGIGANVFMSPTCTSDYTQKWFYDPTTLSIRSYFEGFCLTANIDTESYPITISDCR